MNWFLKNRLIKRVNKSVWLGRVYTDEYLDSLSEKDLLALKRKFSKELGFWFFLLILLLVVFSGFRWVDSSGNLPSYSETPKQEYVDESNLLKEYLNDRYGSGNWNYEVYSPGYDAYTVNAEGHLRYFQVIDGKIYEVEDVD